MLCTGWHEPVLTSATSRRTWGATERRSASTPPQVAGAGGGGRADSQPADQALAVDGERNLSPREDPAGGDDGDQRARFTGLDREQLDAGHCLQSLVEHGRADVGEEGRVEVGADLRAGHGQMGHRCDEPPELGPGRRTGRGNGLHGSRRGCGAGRSRRAARGGQEHHRGHQHHQERPRWTAPPTTSPATEPRHSFSSCTGKYSLWPPDQSLPVPAGPAEPIPSDRTAMPSLIDNEPAGDRTITPGENQSKSAPAVWPYGRRIR